MFDVGGPEFLFLLLLALLVFGPRRLPKMGRKLGGFVGEMRRSLSDFRGHLEREVAYEEMREVAQGLKDVGRSTKDAARGLVDADAGAWRSPPPDQKPGAKAADDGGGEAGEARAAEAETAYRRTAGGDEDGGREDSAPPEAEDRDER
jgi:sec-independent protein translocase protein TatB